MNNPTDDKKQNAKSTAPLGTDSMALLQRERATTPDMAGNMNKIVRSETVNNLLKSRLSNVNYPKNQESSFRHFLDRNLFVVASFLCLIGEGEDATIHYYV